MLIRMADGTVHFLDYREKAPKAATADMYLDKQGNVVPKLSTVGYKAIAVPGSVAGMAKAEKDWGKLGLARVMAPAIKLARDGFPLPYEYEKEFQDETLSQFPESRRIFQRNGNWVDLACYIDVLWIVDDACQQLIIPERRDLLSVSLPRHGSLQLRIAT